MIYNTLIYLLYLCGYQYETFSNYINHSFILCYCSVLGLKNQQLVTLHFLVAQNELRLSTLLAIIFAMGFSVAACF